MHTAGSNQLLVLQIISGLDLIEIFFTGNSASKIHSMTIRQGILHQTSVMYVKNPLSGMVRLSCRFQAYYGL